MTKSTVYIAIGTNLGEREANYKKAVELLAGLGEVRSTSSLYDTAPRGELDQPRFINAAVELSTTLSPDELLVELKSIEEQMGRSLGGKRNGPRVIDLDILFFGDMVLDEDGLTIPHPRMFERAFVLVPLFDIAPDVIHPVIKKTVRELLYALSAEDKADVKRIDS